MRIAIDATSIRAGGGLTHLSELLVAARPELDGIERVTVYGHRSTLDRLPVRPWLYAHALSERVRPFPGDQLWHQTRIATLARAEADVLFVPGGTFAGRFRPLVAMSQNLLPFDPVERGRFGWSWPRLRYAVLERSQATTFRRADGVVFLSETARRVVVGRTGPLAGRTCVIPHGIAAAFRRPPVPAGDAPDVAARPFRWLYVSIVNYYKHPWHVAEAAAILHRAGLPIDLDLVGPAHPPALRRLRQVLDRVDPAGAFVRYRGPVSHAEAPGIYHRADGFVFASSCENMPNIVVEAMASSLPIACSDRGPMPEILGDAGVFFDPERPADIARAMRALMEDRALREQCARRAYERAAAFSWERCARETLGFLAGVAAQHGAR